MKTAAHYFELAAEQGDIDAQAEYGYYLEHGIGLDCDVARAAHYYKLAADHGRAYDAGFRSDLDPVNESFTPHHSKSLKGIPDLGHGRAQLLLVLLGMAGIWRKGSVFRLISPADGGNPDGRNNLGILLERSTKLAASCYRLAKYCYIAAIAGNAHGMNNFGLCLEPSLWSSPTLYACGCILQKGSHADGANNFGFCLEHGRD